MNKVILIGRLTREPDIRWSQGEEQLCIARYTLAVDRRGTRDGDEQTADFISCIAFGRVAEFVDKYLRKGTKIAVVGHIQTGSYTNKDGVKVYTTDVVIESHEFCESLGTSGGQEREQDPQRQAKADRDRQRQSSGRNQNSGSSRRPSLARGRYDDDELPFT